MATENIPVEGDALRLTPHEFQLLYLVLRQAYTRKEVNSATSRKPINPIWVGLMAKMDALHKRYNEPRSDDYEQVTGG